MGLPTEVTETIEVTAGPLKRTESLFARQPWKYYGYKAFSEWSASDNDFFAIRRFGALNTRVILKWQDDICRLEEKLAKIDEENSQVDENRVNNGSFRKDRKGRNELLEECFTKLKEYNEFLAAYMEFRARPRAQSHEICNIKNWHQEYEGAIEKEEANYIDNTDDLISIVPKIKSPLRRLLEKMSSRRWRIFRVKPELTTLPSNYDPETTQYYSDARMETFCTIVINTAGLTMLIAPLWWLLFVRDPMYQLAIITGFVLLFVTIISSVTVAKPFEALAGTAGYSAVLMVFMQMGGSGGS